jgi:lipoyl(octanoyl) transferase
MMGAPFTTTVESPSSKTNSSATVCHDRPTRAVRLFDVSATLTPYQDAWAWQQSTLKLHLQGQREGRQEQDALLLLQHPAVYTLGRGAKEEDLLGLREAGDAEVHRVERGGDVTHHCPGQLVGYPILDLNHYKRDCHWYLRMLEETVIAVLAEYGIQGERHPEYTGVWVGGSKVAAIGVNVSRWVTMHGFAINVNCDLGGFRRIVPCGISDPTKSVASIYSLLGMQPSVLPTGAPPVTLEAVSASVQRHFNRIFNTDLHVDLKWAPGTQLSNY